MTKIAIVQVISIQNTWLLASLLNMANVDNWPDSIQSFTVGSDVQKLWYFNCSNRHISADVELVYFTLCSSVSCHTMDWIAVNTVCRESFANIMCWKFVLY